MARSRVFDSPAKLIGAVLTLCSSVSRGKFSDTHSAHHDRQHELQNDSPLLEQYPVGVYR